MGQARAHAGQHERASARDLLLAWLDEEGRIELLPAEATDYLLAWVVHQQRRTGENLETYVRDCVEMTRRYWKRTETVRKVCSLFVACVTSASTVVSSVMSSLNSG